VRRSLSLPRSKDTRRRTDSAYHGRVRDFNNNNILKYIIYFTTKFSYYLAIFVFNCNVHRCFKCRHKILLFVLIHLYGMCIIILLFIKSVLIVCAIKTHVGHEYQFIVRNPLKTRLATAVPTRAYIIYYIIIYTHYTKMSSLKNRNTTVTWSPDRYMYNSDPRNTRCYCIMVIARWSLHTKISNLKRAAAPLTNIPSSF